MVQIYSESRHSRSSSLDISQISEKKSKLAQTWLRGKWFHCYKHFYIQSLTLLPTQHDDEWVTMMVMASIGWLLVSSVIGKTSVCGGGEPRFNTQCHMLHSMV